MFFMRKEKKRVLGNVLDVGGTCITTHRAVLGAQSEYFKTMLAPNFKKQQDGKISIDDTMPNAFRALLRYLHTDKLKHGCMCCYARHMGHACKQVLVLHK